MGLWREVTVSLTVKAFKGLMDAQPRISPGATAGYIVSLHPFQTCSQT